MINAITSALSGLTTASKQVDASAQSIASGTNADNLIKDVVDIKQAEISYKANLAVLKTANELTDELLKAFDETV